MAYRSVGLDGMLWWLGEIRGITVQGFCGRSCPFEYGLLFRDASQVTNLDCQIVPRAKNPGLVEFGITLFVSTLLGRWMCVEC